MSSLNLYISDADKAELKRISAVTGKSASYLVREMITALSTQHPTTETIHLVWELRDITYCKIKTKAWVSKDQRCYILRNPYNQRLNITQPCCDTDVIQAIANNRYKIKILSEMIYDTYIDTKSITASNGGYSHDGIVWESIPTTESVFYFGGVAAD